MVRRLMKGIMRSLGHSGRRRVAGLLVLSLLAGMPFSGAFAGIDEQVVSKFVGKNWVNGRSWDLLDYSGKLGFVCGVFDGITLFCSMAESGKTVKKSSLDSIYNSLSVPTSLTVGDVVRGMDEFYKDPANMQLPAICAYMHFIYKSRGESSEAIGKHVFRWRKMFKE